MVVSEAAAALPNDTGVFIDAIALIPSISGTGSEGTEAPLALEYSSDSAEISETSELGIVGSLFDVWHTARLRLITCETTGTPLGSELSRRVI